MLENSGFTTTLTTDDDDNLTLEFLTLEFPDGLLDAMGWKEGDTLNIQAFAGRVILSKVPPITGNGA